MMPARLLILALLPFAFLLGGCRPSEVAAAPLLPVTDLQEGDLAFRCGQGFFSHAVTSAEEDPQYSHVGLLVREGDAWMVVHAVPAEPDFAGDFDRVKADSLTVFFSPGRAVRGCLVHTGLEDSLKLSCLREWALGLARDSVRFDASFSLADSSRLYCTELVWRLYRRCGTDLSEGRRRNLDVFRIHGECLLPEHLYVYSGNNVYFKY